MRPGKEGSPWLLSKLALWALGFVPTGEVWEPLQKTHLKIIPHQGPGIWGMETAIPGVG